VRVASVRLDCGIPMKDGGTTFWKSLRLKWLNPVNRDQVVLCVRGAREEQQGPVLLQLERYLVQGDGSILFLGSALIRLLKSVFLFILGMVPAWEGQDQ